MFKSRDSQARVSLHHTLGHLHQQHPHHARYEGQKHQYHRQSPSKLRRRVPLAMARSAATAAKETFDDNALEDASKHVINAVKAESSKPNISSSVNAATTDETRLGLQCQTLI